MLLENKNAVIYGAGGAKGGAVASTFSREGRTFTWPVVRLMASRRWPRRSAPLEDVGNVAAFAASDHARAMTATAINISSGANCGLGGGILVSMDT